jgi:uncharacterized protein (DUF1697 family)
VHLFFLSAAPDGDAEDRLAAVVAASESFVLDGRILYLHAPDGIGRSKLVARAERLLGVGATARNWRTVTGLLALADDHDAVEDG